MDFINSIMSGQIGHLPVALGLPILLGVAILVRFLVKNRVSVLPPSKPELSEAQKSAAPPPTSETVPLPGKPVSAAKQDLEPPTGQGGTGRRTATEVSPSPRGLKSLLAKTQAAFTSQLDALILSTKKFDDSFVDSLEELLYTSDLGTQTVERLLTAVREKLSKGELSDLATVKKALYDEVSQILASANAHMKVYNNGDMNGSMNGSGAGSGNGSGLTASRAPWVILVVGVNGVGKTTSIGKLAQYYTDKKKKVLVVAGDTFRAAAEAQLGVWGERAQVEVFTATNTKDAAAVAFQGLEKGRSENFDVIIIDTAGRLHNKENLMEELKKVKRVIGKAQEGAPHEIILVIDANSGQNARVQAQQFNENLGVTSLIVTKLDGTARGGVIVSIAEEAGLAVQFIGTGEKISDLSKFSTEEYARELLQLD